MLHTSILIDAQYRASNLKYEKDIRLSLPLAVKIIPSQERDSQGYKVKS